MRSTTMILATAAPLALYLAGPSERPGGPDRRPAEPPSLSMSHPAAVGRLTSEQAIAAALNDVSTIDGGYRLEHPRHEAEFTADGLVFRHRGTALDWRWTLERVSADDEPLASVDIGPIEPVRGGRELIRYERGPIIEKYLLRGGCIEQQFEIPRPVELDGRDLIIDGRIASAGVFGEHDGGWSWRAGHAVVDLGHVTVIDADGRALPSRMEVTAESSRIIVDAPALAHAAYPVTIDPEIGANDFAISDMGVQGSSDYASDPAVAYSTVSDRYLVVWKGETFGTLEEDEIYGQLVDAGTGAEIGPNDFRISDMGPDGVGTFRAKDPDLAYNPVLDQFLVVWEGDDDSGALAPGEFEIFGQLIDAATGQEIGPNDFRISQMGLDGIDQTDARDAAVAFDATRNEYLVVWSGDGVIDGKFEIFGQLVDASGAEIGPDDVLISAMGDPIDDQYDAFDPSVAYNESADVYCVVWEGDDDVDGLVNGELEIFGRFVDPETGVPTALPQFRLSDMGPDGVEELDATDPAVASGDNTFLVVWRGDDLVDGEYEIHGQLIDPVSGEEIGSNDLRISDMGPDGDNAYRAYDPDVVYDAADDTFAVVWRGDDAVDNEYEVHAQLIDAGTGQELGPNDLRVSHVGPDGDTDFDAWDAVVAFDGSRNEILVVWVGNDDGGSMSGDPEEIFGRRLDGASLEPTGDQDRLSDMEVTFDPSRWVDHPAVAYDTARDRYLVVWSGRDDVEIEIHGQLIDAATGEEIGPNDLRISDMGLDGVPEAGAFAPDVAYDAANDSYYVVWMGDDQVDNQIGIHGQWLSASTLTELGENDYFIEGPGAYDPAIAAGDGRYLVVWRSSAQAGDLEISGASIRGDTGQISGGIRAISFMGDPMDPNAEARAPDVAYSSAHDEYLVVWAGDEGVDEEFEIWCRRTGHTGSPIGPDSVRISNVGPAGNTDFGAASPAATYHPLTDEYLVVWTANANQQDRHEVFGQRLTAASGAEVGPDDFQISNLGPGSYAWDPDVTPVTDAAAAGGYLVVWSGDSSIGGSPFSEYEIYGQMLDQSGSEIGPDDFRISDLGPDGEPLFVAKLPRVVFSPVDQSHLVVWSGSDEAGPLAYDEPEIFGQLIDARDCNENGLPDAQDLADGVLSDTDANGIPDECDPGIDITSQADLNDDGIVDVQDLLILLASWGMCDGCPADLDGDGAVSVVDLLELFADWG